MSKNNSFPPSLSLSQGEHYYVRVSAYNMKGFGPTESSTPLCAMPSSWHDVAGSGPRYEGCTDKIHLVAAQFGLTVAPMVHSGECLGVCEVRIHTTLQ